MGARLRERTDTASIHDELRAARASRHRVTLQLSARCERPYLSGRVDHMAASGAYVLVGDWHIPTDDIRCVERK